MSFKSDIITALEVIEKPFHIDKLCKYVTGKKAHREERKRARALCKMYEKTGLIKEIKNNFFMSGELKDIEQLYRIQSLHEELLDKKYTIRSYIGYL